MWDEIAHPFPKFIRAAIEVSEYISKFTLLYCACDYLSMLELKLVKGVQQENHWDEL